jgi:eukaryotic-like serine/threonine-protein kinase
MRLDTGTKLGAYEIVESIGAGGMGEVYRARDDRLRRDVAVKVLPAHLSTDADYLARFEREAQAVAQLSHPNILSIHDFGQDHGVTYAVTELLEGATLRRRLDAGTLPWRDAVAIGVAVADGLAAAHAKGIVHRDLKPENLFLSRDGRPKILDFGIARWAEPASPDEDTRALSDGQPTRPGTVLGTMGYMSPEQVRGHLADHRSDLFSLGATLYEMLGGRRAFTGPTQADTMSAILKEDPAPLPANLGIPASLDAILRRCLRKSPDERFQSARELRAALQSVLEEQQQTAATSPRPARRRIVVSAAAVAALILAVLAVWSLQRAGNAKVARQQLLPEIERLAAEIPWTNEGPSGWAAYALATRANRAIPGDPTLQRLWGAISSPVDIRSEPPGARVFAKPYGQPDAAWTSFGQTPLAALRFPKGFSRIRLELDGYDAVNDIVWTLEGAQSYRLQPAGSVPVDMVYVDGSEHALHAVGLDHLSAEQVDAYYMDRLEVTNKAYKRFVDSGGYRNRTYWTFPFVKDGRELGWAEAMALFVDRTGRPGPSTWEVGDYPEGQDDYPVMGVSWYEAAAYAAFAGKQLPTIFHWDLVAYLMASGEIIPLSNYDSRGPAPVGSRRAMSRFGALDMAGNAREWTFNGSDRAGDHFILGGGWNDEAYSFNDAYTQDGFDRSATNGFRCMQPVEAGGVSDRLTRRIELPFRDYAGETPVTDEVFRLFLRPFEYDRTPLNARVDSVDDTTSDDWTRETITFDAAYGTERVRAYLYLPRRGQPPYQTIVAFPGDQGFGISSSEGLRPAEHFLKSGRAYLFPVYKGTYERRDELTSSMPNESNTYREHVVYWSKDLRRSIDYLETRRDIDTQRLAFFGMSWGGRMAPVMLATEGRLKAAVVMVAGLRHQKAQPEADPFNYLPRVTLPVLMLNGRYDFYFPVETSQRPYFERLGTPAADKSWKVYDGSHSVPATQLAKESLAWLDRYLGPVR